MKVSRRGKGILSMPVFVLFGTAIAILFIPAGVLLLLILLLWKGMDRILTGLEKRGL